MRYLWVEDFDGDSKDKHTIKEKWEKYFQLEGKTRVFQTLESVLEFLEDPAKWKLFDAVLIDIRFSICEKLKEDDIYIKYFSEFLKKEKFEQYARQVNGDPCSASAGILLFLALVHRYNYNQSRIAFISANVDGTGNKLSCLKSIREYLYKAQYEVLTEDDIKEFSLLNQSLSEIYGEAKDIAKEGRYASLQFDDEMDFPFTNEIDWEEVKGSFKKEDSLFEKVNKIEELIILPLSEETEDKLKYNSVKAEFAEVGLLVPIAFEKPSGSEQTTESWSFKFWAENILNTEYYQLRSLILPICLNLQRAIEEGGEKNIEIIKPYLDMNTEFDNAKNELLEMLDNIAELLPPNIWTEKSKFLYQKIIKECVTLCEKVGNLQKSGKAILKLTRNWLSHQGIENIVAFDVAFVFHVMVNTFFSLSCDENCKRLDQIMISSICKDNKNVTEEVIETCKKKAIECHRKAFERVPENERKKGCSRGYCYKENAKLYDTISGIGHEYSPIRKSVSMKDLYLLFLCNAKENNENEWERELILELIKRLEKYREEE